MVSMGTTRMVVVVVVKPTVEEEEEEVAKEEIEEKGEESVANQKSRWSDRETGSVKDENKLYSCLISAYLVGLFSFFFVYYVPALLTSVLRIHTCVYEAVQSSVLKCPDHEARIRKDTSK
ncbi:hypothetical protein ALC53_13354 [Atta colombica]|uniref:Uncharacterized protein n=1 Tax=Atta colombica TaxID=520822 RepID=A0A195AW99_9HYME|nr:hypothetical protein ALC53_13354 [Atta colombica]